MSATAFVSAAQPPSPEATAPPSSPSRWLRGCWALAVAAVVLPGAGGGLRLGLGLALGLWLGLGLGRRWGGAGLELLV